MSASFSEDLLSWYSDNARALPWRDTRDPYAIWVSEVMLQQTRVETVIPYYQRWMRRFPDVETLAQAEVEQVLSVWEGLGYYQRAHNMHKAASQILETYAGEIPGHSTELERLPGIGPYTAAAISSIAFGERVIALDGNMRRIFARILNYDQVVSTAKAEQRFRSWAMKRFPPSSASEYNQALMDLGAMICTPRAPNCESCPVSSHCEALVLGVQELRPIRRQKRQVPSYRVSAGVLIRKGSVLIGRRPAEKLLGGLWEFPGGKCLPGEGIPDCLRREWKEELDMDIVPGSEIGVIGHAYTHFRVEVHALLCEGYPDQQPRAQVHSEVRWAPIDRLKTFPMGKVDRSIAVMVAKLDPPGE